MAVVKNQIFRSLLFCLGIVAAVLGFIGIFVPLLPTTPFVLLAAWCFLRSSAKAHQWIYRQPFLGQALKDWEATKSIRRTTKILAVSMILFSMVLISLKVHLLGVRIPILLFLLCIAVFIVTRPERSKPLDPH